MPGTRTDFVGFDPVSMFVLQVVFQLFPQGATTLSAVYWWVEAFELDASLMRRKLPVHALLGRIAPLFPPFGFRSARRQSWHPSVQALPGPSPAFDLGAMEPTPMLGGMVKLQPRGPRTGLLG
jgi:hypothetical protein